jgi:hypothetical protein
MVDKITNTHTTVLKGDITEVPITTKVTMVMVNFI